MITDYFNNETWMESHGRFRSTWKSLYDPDTGICETHVSVNDREPSITYERIYPTDFLLESLRGQGFVLLAARDMHTWKAPTHRTTRIDIIAAKGDDLPYRNKFKTVDNSLRKLLGK
jgi:hypothetical protein